MPTFPTVRVAAVQATPVMLDGEACIDLAIDRMRVADDCDLRVGLRATQGFDAVGHYGREDVLLGLLTGAAAARNGAATTAPAQAPAES